MNALITIIITIVATAITTEVIHECAPSWRKKLKNVVPKKKRARLITKTAIKYPFLFIFMCLIFICVPFGRWFVASFAFVSLVISAFISRDILLYSLNRFFISAEEDNIKRDIQLWKWQLATCDGQDEQRINMIMEKLANFEKQLAKL
jgi:putative ribosome biogenesis GTPase RsgA